MDHVAIMRKSWGLTPKILNGQKRIESRWYSVRYKPWDRIKKGDTVYFKNSGEPIIAKANVKKVLQFSDLTPGKVKDLLRSYGKRDGIDKAMTQKFFERFKNKNYCILVFLSIPVAVAPFQISKKGMAPMSAWITVDEIAKITV